MPEHRGSDVSVDRECEVDDQRQNAFDRQRVDFVLMQPSLVDGTEPDEGLQEPVDPP